MQSQKNKVFWLLFLFFFFIFYHFFFHFSIFDFIFLSFFPIFYCAYGFFCTNYISIFSRLKHDKVRRNQVKSNKITFKFKFLPSKIAEQSHVFIAWKNKRYVVCWLLQFCFINPWGWSLNTSHIYQKWNTSYIEPYKLQNSLKPIVKWWLYNQN